ncbi:MAG: ABC transporter permease [Gammaproteobacteria bacterium RIFCSPHIGHO2_12_FULL_63_22]|nr:MAG: ABC transporter permease [Gammaproteobacteria bacterium RIFCSPHIGHO2_12_FULL_63_22]
MSDDRSAIKPVSQWRMAIDDLVEGLKAHRVWMMLAKMDIRQRYRRSVIGPFWITITMVIWILAIGPLYSHLLGIGSEEFIPYLAMGIITWGLISGVLLDGAGAFVSAENLVRSVKLPYTVHILRALQRNLIIFLHNLLAFVPFMLFLGVRPEWSWLMAIPGVVLILLAAIPTAFLLGTLSARYRDLQQMIASIVQLAFFITPIFWKAELLRDRMYLADYNPFQILLEGVRGPIVSGVPGAIVYFKIAVLLGLLYLIAAPFFVRYRRRLAFWV